MCRIIPNQHSQNIRDHVGNAELGITSTARKRLSEVQRRNRSKYFVHVCVNKHWKFFSESLHATYKGAPKTFAGCGVTESFINSPELRKLLLPDRCSESRIFVEGHTTDLGISGDVLRRSHNPFVDRESRENKSPTENSTPGLGDIISEIANQPRLNSHE